MNYSNKFRSDRGKVFFQMEEFKMSILQNDRNLSKNCAIKNAFKFFDSLNKVEIISIKQI